MRWVELYQTLGFELVFNRSFVLASTTQLCWAHEGQSLWRVSVPTWHISDLKFQPGYPFWQRSALKHVNQSIFLLGRQRVQILSYTNIASKVTQQHSFYSWILKALLWLSQINVSQNHKFTVTTRKDCIYTSWKQTAASISTTSF